MREIYISNTFDAAFERALAPWFKGCGRLAWRNPKPTLVIGPDQCVLTHLKGLLHAGNIPSFGVEFVTAGRLLSLLVGKNAPMLPDASLMDLVAEQVARKLAAETKNEVAGAVSRGPGILTDTLKVLHQGGWDATAIPGDMLQRIGEAVEDALAAAGLTTEALAAHAVAKDNVGVTFGSVLVIGFDARHWAHWPSLLALLRRSENFTAVFAPSRAMAEDADLCWLASWEAAAGVSLEMIDESSSGVADLIEQATEGKASGVTCLAASSQMEEAKLAIRCAAEALENGAQSVGIVAPPNSVVAREIGLLLAGSMWPHFDGLPSRQSSVSRPEVLVAMLRVQADPFVANLAHFLRLRPYLPEDIGVSAASAVRGLARLAPNLIFPELSIAAEYIKANGDQRLLPVIEKWPLWPDEDTLGAYLDNLVSLTEWLQWAPMLRLAKELQQRLAPARLVRVTRSGVCGFFEAVLVDSQNHRADNAGHPYARILLLSPERALWRRWDTLVIAGQNDGIWPPRSEPGGYLSEDDLLALNRRIFALNETAKATVAASGEGALPVQDGHAYIVGPFEYRGLQIRDFVRLVAAAKHTYVLCALRDESQGDLTLYPGELFSRAYAAAYGKVPSARDLEESAGIVGRSLPLQLAVAPAAHVPVDQMVHAWRQRRRADATTFSEYEFCMEGRPSWDLIIPPSSFGRVFEHPAEIYFRHFLGVEPREQDREELAAPMVTGNWIHAWLEGAAPTGKAAHGHEWVERVQVQATALRSRVAAALAAHGREVPTWWDSIFDQTVHRARLFASALARGARHPYVISEAKLPRTVITLDSGRKLAVEGRMDLVFSDTPVQSGPEALFAGRPWLYDFKSGADKVLSAESLRAGEGIQLGLYSLGIKERGADIVDITLLRDDCEATPQVTSDDVRREMMPWLERLANIMDTGRLGYVGPIHSTYSRSIYPIATLPVNVDLKPRFKKLHEL